jgi:putative addiction module component (TIGR02574 family)
VIQPAESSISLERDIANVQSALARAAQHARERARQYGTSVVIAENGHVRHLDPNEENGRRSPVDASETVAAPGSPDRHTLKLAEFHRLSIDDRIRLVHDIWDSIAQDSAGAEELPESHAQELHRRYVEYLKDGDKGQTWEEVKQAILDQ